MNLSSLPVPILKVLPYVKFAVALLGAALTAALTYGVSLPAWVPVVVASATALGVYSVPNKQAVVPGDDKVAAAGPAAPPQP